MEKPLCEYCKLKSKLFFDKLVKDDLIELSTNKTCKIYKKGEVLFHKGRIPAGIYCLYKGKIKIYKIGLDGKEQIVRLACPGELIGLRSLLGDDFYSASAATLEESVVCFIKKDIFFYILNKYPEIYHYLITTLTHLLEKAEDKITSLAQKTVKERLAESLIILSKTFNPDKKLDGHPVITLTREDLASIVGTATETIIRLLSKFKEQKLIDTKGRKIIILNSNELVRVANIID